MPYLVTLHTSGQVLSYPVQLPGARWLAALPVGPGTPTAEAAVALLVDRDRDPAAADSATTQLAVHLLRPQVACAVDTVPLGAMPRRIAYVPEHRAVAVAVQAQHADPATGEVVERSALLLLDEADLAPIDYFPMDPGEKIMALAWAPRQLPAASGHPARQGCVVVGTAYVFPMEATPRLGRLLAFTVRAHPALPPGTPVPALGAGSLGPDDLRQTRAAFAQGPGSAAQDLCLPAAFAVLCERAGRTTPPGAPGTPLAAGWAWDPRRLVLCALAKTSGAVVAARAITAHHALVCAINERICVFELGPAGALSLGRLPVAGPGAAAGRLGRGP